MKSPIYQFFAKTPPFSLLPKKELETISGKTTIENCSTGAILSVQDETTIDNVYIVKNGYLEIYYKKEGRKTIKNTIRTGEIFGGISLLMNFGLSVRTVTAARDTLLYVIEKDVFLEISERNKSFHQYFIKEFQSRMADDSYASIIETARALNFLSEIAPFSFLPKDELEIIASKFSIVQYPKGEIIFIQGRSKIDHLHIIKKGAAERYYEEKDNKKLRGLLSDGDIFGGISMLLNEQVAVRTLKATEDTFFYTLPCEYFLAVCDRFSLFSEYFTHTFGKRMLDKSYASIIAKNLVPREEAPQFFNQSVSNIYSTDIVACGNDLSIKEAARIMSRQNCSSIFIRDSENRMIGIVTDNDLRKKVISKGYDIDKPISDIMSSPLEVIPAQSLIFDALMRMMQKNLKHLAVVDSDEKVMGVITNHDLLTSQGQSPVFLIREISKAATIETILEKHNQVPKLIQNLINSGAKAKNVNRFITTVSDSILNRLIEFAIKELGPPPAKFVFMVLGSEGRNEQTLKTDQDNAIVFEDVPAAEKEDVNEYFLKFGNKVCAWLDQAGYDYCTGDIMAKNPRWCQPLSTWKEYFYKWIHAAKPEDLLRSSIFFDFRGAYGDVELINQLRRYLFNTLVGWAGFFRHLTENALYFKPPIGFFRDFVVESKGEHRDSFDIKHAMMPIIDFARVHALKNGIEQTNTLERLHQIYLQNKMAYTDYNEIELAYSFLMQLRFIRQISAIEKKQKPNNYINPKKLSGIEQKMLKEIFKKIESMQANLGFEFTGIM